jgi:preprotein translocase subunit SecA
MEDDLMRIFGGSRMQGMMERLGVPDDMPIENNWISKSLEGAQKRVEGHNFDIRKHLVQYDDIANTHRDIVYKRRQGILENENLKNDMLVMIETHAEKLVLSHTGETRELWERVMAIHKDSTTPLALETLEPLDPEARMETIKNYFRSEYLEKERTLPDPKMMRTAERMVALRVLDSFWMRHLTELKELREAVSLSGYGQRDPLIEFKNHAYRIFEEMMNAIDDSTVQGLFRVKIQVNPIAKPLEATAKTPTEAELKEAGRNDLCPCGSGKKFKKCHGA